jgi:hypothetical protein
MRVPRTEIAHLDTGVKEAARLRFFEALTGPAADAQRAG